MSLAMDDKELLDLLLKEEAGIEAPQALPAPCSGEAPLSRAQTRLWFLQQLAPRSCAYHIPCAVRFTGRLDLAALRAGLNAIVRRHEALRTCFPSVEGKPRAEVSTHFSLDIPLEDLSGACESVLLRRCAEEVSRPFDLARAPLLRARLFKRDEGEHVALLVLHHIVADGWSMGVLLQELNTLYQAGLPDPLPPLAFQYGDFARWQDHWLEAEAGEDRAWWKQHLAGLVPLELPADRPHPARRGGRGSSLSFKVPQATAATLKRLGRQEGASLFMTLLAVFAVLLHRYSGQSDIAVGSPVANRSRREFEPLIGLFVNTLVLRCDLSGRPGFREVLRRVRDFALGALARQDFPFDEMVREIAPEREGSANPLFQVMFSMENIRSGTLQLPGLTMTPLDLPTETAKFDLLLNLVESEDGLGGAFEYAADLFDETTVARMAGHYGRLLEAIGTEPDADIGLLPLLTDPERRQLLRDWNDTRTDYPAHMSLAALFERQVAQTPEATALEYGELRLSYRELNGRANRLARHLRRCGVVPDTPVAVHLRRSADMILGLLAVLKAGGYYVPLDTAYPQNRLRLMLQDCKARVLVTQSDLVEALAADGLTIVRVDEAGEWAGHDDDNLDAAVDGGHLAYVIYTSGSTGRPKGVAVPQRAVARLVLDTNYVCLRADDRMAQNSNTSFDAATFEIWGALLNGASLVGVDRDLSLSPPEFARFLKEQRITTLFLTTALFNQMARDVPEGFATLRHLLFGGEAADPRCVRAILRHGPPQRLLHVYGPTENTTFSTWYPVRHVPEDAATVPIGSALCNTQLYVLDQRLQPVPVGVPGELYLGGEGLAQGYLHRPDLTEQSFIQSPFREGQRLYKTGDTVRWLPGGELEFIGRRDSQVKIRGFRIEPAEIEAWLVRQRGVREAVVLVREGLPGQLVAYVAGEDAAGLSEPRLREEMAEDLPAYMVPARFVFLDQLPLSPNGKVDRRALPLPSEVSPEPAEADPLPQSQAEQALLDIWRSVLGGREVRATDNYFQLGGDSITAIQLVSRIRKAGWELSVRDLFDHPTVRSLAPKLRRPESDAESTHEAASGPVPLTPIQSWFFREHTGQLHHFNQAVLLKPAERLDAACLRQVLQALWERHDALRLSYVLPSESRSEHFDLPTQAPAAESRSLYPSPSGKVATKATFAIGRRWPEGPDEGERPRGSREHSTGHGAEWSLPPGEGRGEGNRPWRECFPAQGEHERHDRLEGDRVSQRLDGSCNAPGFELVDLRHERDAQASLEAHADRVQAGFDLERGPLFKAVLFRLADSDRLLLVIHHLAVDGVSWRILLEELQSGYRQYLEGGGITLDPKTDSFQRWALQLQRFAGSDAVLADRAYWAGVLARQAPAFPRDMEHAGDNRYGESETVHTLFSAEETARVLRDTHRAYDTEVNDLLLAALGLALRTRNGGRHALITLEGHGREPLDVDLDLSRTVGWFTCCYPFLLPTAEVDPEDQIRAVRDALRRVPRRGLSFGLLRYLTPARQAPGLERDCRPQLSFNYLGQFEGGEASGWAFAPESGGRAISPELERPHDLDMVGVVTDGRLAFSILYHPLRHRRESVQGLLDAFREQLLRVAEHCRARGPAKPASREFTFGQLPEDDLDMILQSLSREA